MKIKDLIKELRKYPQDQEIVIQERYGMPGTHASFNPEFIRGYMVCDPEGYYSKKEGGKGIFIEKKQAQLKQSDGKELLDLSSPTIYPSVFLRSK